MKIVEVAQKLYKCEICEACYASKHVCEQCEAAKMHEDSHKLAGCTPGCVIGVSTRYNGVAELVAVEQPKVVPPSDVIGYLATLTDYELLKNEIKKPGSSNLELRHGLTIKVANEVRLGKEWWSDVIPLCHVVYTKK